MNTARQLFITAGLVCLLVEQGLVQSILADPWLAQPVNDVAFKAYLKFFSYDHELPFDALVIDRRTDDGISREHLTFQSTLGERVSAYFYQATTQPDTDWPGVIVLHGGSAPGKDARIVGRLASDLVRLGLKVLAIDMKHFGERDSDVLTTFTEPDKHKQLYNHPSRYLDWIVQTVKDVGRSYDFLVERGANPARVGLTGSRGAVVAAIAAVLKHWFD